MDNILYLGVFGSHLYGTSTPSSDRDYKQIHKDALSDIVLKRDKDNINNSTNTKTRNTSADVDFESKELRQFIYDCLNGQTYAFDILFTPKNLWAKTSPIWNDLVKNRDNLITRNVKPFIGYCVGQAGKYSLKGDKLKVLLELKEVMSKYETRLSIGEFFRDNPELATMKFVRGYDKEIGKGNCHSIEHYFDICTASFPSSRQLAEAIPSINLMIKNFGDRSKTAMENGGIDLKAYYHALRIAWELEEYLTTAHITLPHPRASELLAVRNGEFTKEYVENWINDEIDRILRIPNNLPAAKFEYWDEWILSKYIRKDQR